jgi:small subunit ribosomal protein S9
VTEQPENEQPRDEVQGAPQAGADADAAQDTPADVPGEPEAPVGPTAEAPAEEAEPTPVTPAAPQSGGEPAADEPPAAPEAPASQAPAPEAPAPEAPAASETPAADEAPAAPAASEAPVAAEAPAAAEARAAAAAPETPAAPAPAGQPAAEDEDYDPTPRQRPEIPGADLIPDIVPEGQEFLDAEAQAAAEAEAEALAAREQEAEDSSLPIADAAIDLAAGARYTSTGKRKTAVARVILKPGDGTYTINGKTLEEFFPRETLQRIIRQPLETVGYESRMDVVARMHGGGVAAQAGALRHGISRALIVADPNLRGELKRRGFLTRDPRVKERKKAGLKKARKRPQFSKR